MFKRVESLNSVGVHLLYDIWRLRFDYRCHIYSFQPPFVNHNSQCECARERTLSLFGRIFARTRCATAQLNSGVCVCVYCNLAAVCYMYVQASFVLSMYTLFQSTVNRFYKLYYLLTFI